MKARAEMPRLGLELVAEVGDLIAQIARHPRRRRQRITGAGDYHCVGAR